jgi:hypothetical protein|tara:strand:+ start:888 stop:1559 length:672 start_codon:yes stop_codon:yes gene_type:complete
MSDNENDDYEVGYGKPPKSTQFKKGQSGNPRGRPKKQHKDVAAHMAALLAKRRPVRIDGETVLMSGEEVMAHRLMEKALKGDPKAFDKVHQLKTQHAEAEARIAQAAEGPKPLIIELVHAKIPEEECYKRPGERINYNKEKNTITRETWPGYLPDDVADVAEVDEAYVPDDAAEVVEADDPSQVDTWNEPDNEEPNDDDGPEDDAGPNNDDFGAYGLCIEHDI